MFAFTLKSLINVVFYLSTLKKVWCRIYLETIFTQKWLNFTHNCKEMSWNTFN